MFNVYSILIYGATLSAFALIIIALINKIVFKGNRKIDFKEFCIGLIGVLVMSFIINAIGMTFDVYLYFISIIIPIGIAIGLFALILMIINKLIFRGKRKIDFKEFAIGWVVIFVFNLICVLTQAKFAIGIPIHPYLDAGANTYYASLGYFVRVEKSVVASDTSKKVTEFYFPFISDLLK